MRKWKKKCERMGSWIRDSYLSTLNFAGERALIAQDADDLSYMIRKLDDLYKEWGLKLTQRGQSI